LNDFYDFNGFNDLNDLNDFVMNKDSRIYIAGHTGLVGSALYRKLKADGYTHIITRTHAELDLERQVDVENFFEKEKPEYVFLAAAKVGGIWANTTYPAEFIYNNLAIQTNVIHSAWKCGANRLLFLGSSCIYPRECPQPMKEEHFLSGPLEVTNEPYAVAKIAGVEMCQSYNRQYGTDFFAVMPTNLYGPNDNFDLETSHVLAALIRKFHLAKLAAQGDWQAIKKDEGLYGPIPEDVMASLISITNLHGYAENVSTVHRSPLTVHQPQPAVVLWGSGLPRREFLHVDDLADGCLFLMSQEDKRIRSLLTADSLPLLNIGWGKDISIEELAILVKKTVGFDGDIVFDTTKPDGTLQKLLDVTRMAELGWKAKIALKEGIRRVYGWYLENAANS
jgi:GDP-L-fucose synthase